LNVSRATVYALIKRGEIGGKRVGLTIRVHIADLAAFLAR